MAQNGPYDYREDDFLMDDETTGWTYADATAAYIENSMGDSTFTWNNSGTVHVRLWSDSQPKCLICGKSKWSLFNSQPDHDNGAVIFDPEKGLPVTDILWRVVGKHASMYEPVDDGLEDSSAVVMGVPSSVTIKWDSDTYYHTSGSTVNITY